MSADEDTRRLSAASLAEGDPTGWFEKLYAEAADGTAEIPWDRPDASANLVSAGLPRGGGRRALVVGCGLGRDAEFVAGLGYATTAFDISETAVRAARERHPGTPVDYRTADLLSPPDGWQGAFDLVVESNTIQALPRDLRARAIANTAAFVGPGGTLLVLAAKSAQLDGDGPPWPLTRDEVDMFAAPAGTIVGTDHGGPAGDGASGRAGEGGELRVVSIAEIPVPGDPLDVRWRATFRR